MEFKAAYVLTLTLAGLILNGCGPADSGKPADMPQAPAPEPMAAPAPDPAPVSPETMPAPAIDLATLAIKIDPVCKMSLEEHPATATADHGGKTYGFCSEFCKKKFVEDPDKMLARLETPAPEGAPTE